MKHNKRAIRIVIIDDHPVVREGLRGMLASQPDFEVVGDAADGRSGHRLIDELQPDVALLDLRMPVLDGVGLLEAIQSQTLPTRVLVLTTYDNDTDIVRAIQAGATGYLLKDTPREELFRAVRATARGETMLTPAVATRLLNYVRTPAAEQLSEREIEVLSLVATGNSNRQVGRQLHISEATVKTHLLHIYGKLGVNDRTSAVTVALERKILAIE
ncbi:MAG: response regulator transcription factor [Anaerolineales bacterium]|nr:response regulator transcription factor [Anaerolineales bacterium]MCB9128072.1 response regulator transcription factor [Ardenticatenales bacterium]